MLVCCNLLGYEKAKGRHLFIYESFNLEFLIVKRLGLGLGLGIENRESRIKTVPVLTVKCPGPPPTTTHPPTFRAEGVD